MWSSREATKINVALERVGYSPAYITRWWNHSAYPELSGRTPTRAWNDHESDQVRALAEKIVSSRFAEQLPESAAILNRLEASKRS